MSHAEAVRALVESDDPAELAEAVGVLGDDPDTRPEELLPALDRGGYPAEQAAIYLHRMTRLPPSSDGRPMVSRKAWEARLAGTRARKGLGGARRTSARPAQ